jgi:hypothetical protein
MAGTGIGPLRFAFEEDCALAARRCATHIAAVQRLGRTGAAIWKACLGTRQDALRQESITKPLSAFVGEFERLCHVSINFQICVLSASRRR